MTTDTNILAQYDALLKQQEGEQEDDISDLEGEGIAI